MSPPVQAVEPTRVLMLLSNCFDPDPRVYAEARTLVEAGYEVCVLGWDRDRQRPEREVMDGIEVERFYVASTHGRGSTQALVMPLVWLAALRRGLRRDFDIVHAHDFDMLPAARRLARLKRKPIIYDSHEDYASMLHGSIPAAMQKFIRWWETRLIRKVDTLITVGEKLRREFERRGAASTVLVANCKRIPEFRLDQATWADVRAELGIPLDALTISFIANLGAERFIPQLVNAIAQRPEVHLIIGGKGPAEPAVREAAARKANVHYLGFVPMQKVARYTWASDVLYYGFDPSNPNSRWSAPNKLYEALAAGRALISGHFGEIGEVIAQAECGILVDQFTEAEIGRAIDACADRARLRRWQLNAARAGDEKYNWPVSATNLLSAYERLLGRRAFEAVSS